MDWLHSEPLAAGVKTQAIKRLQVVGLFGYLEHNVEFRDGVATIITGPNGSGKTHLLSILRGLVALDFRALLSEPFDYSVLTYTDGSWLEVAHLDGESPSLRVGTGRGDVQNGQSDYTGRPTDPREIEAPPWVSRVGPDEWYDSEAEDWLSTAELARRFGGPAADAGFVEANDWLKTFQSDVPPIFIETKRLDLAIRPPAPQGAYPRRIRREAPSSAIERYVERVRNQVAEARRASLSVSQRADRQFAARALDKARASVKEADLRARYERMAALHQELHANGLTEETISVAFPEGRTNPTERRILTLFLEDWEEKLAPLVPVHERLQVLRGIVEAKLPDKEMRISPRGDVAFLSPTGDELAVDSLSSGEQHMLALFTMLLFTATAGSVVLIDEPEISLHAAWKHAFLDDLDRVSRLIPVKVVLATHSTALINSRWDLVEELDLEG